MIRALNGRPGGGCGRGRPEADAGGRKPMPAASGSDPPASGSDMIAGPTGRRGRAFSSGTQQLPAIVMW